MGKTMKDHLRFSVAWWHSFAWPGGDPFGGQTFERPWFGDKMEEERVKGDTAFEMLSILGETFERPLFGDTMEAARLKADSAFEMFRILGAPFFCWHDLDIRPEGETFAESRGRLEEIVGYIEGKMAETGA